MHTDGRAAHATRALGAQAFTLGSDIAFAPGAYTPGTHTGRQLIAHELAHVAQQTGGAAGPAGTLSTVSGVLQRAPAATSCPPLAIPFPAIYPLYAQAEKTIQSLYSESHRGLISFNKDWTTLNPVGVGEPGEPALRCVQQKWFSGPGGMYAGEPDIWDFTNGTMYEITTPSGTAFRIGKLEAETTLATKLTSTAECGGSSFYPGNWAPTGPCYSLGGDFFISVYNTQGVLVYNLVKDAKKELATAAILAFLAAGVKTGLFQSMGKGLLGAAGKKLLPGYAIASAVAALILISSGRAEAKLGGGGGEPLVELFKALAAKGDPVPPEVQQMIESDPALKKAVEDAISSGGDPTAAQKELSAKVLKLINDNKDQFSADDIKALLAVTQSAGKALPPGDVSVDTLKKLAKAKGVDVDGTGTPDGKTDGKTAQDPKAKGTGTGTGDAASGLSQASRDLIKNAGPGAKLVFDGVFGTAASGAKGPQATDADIARFFSLIPNDVDLAKAKQILAKTLPYKGGSIADVLAGLQAAAAGELTDVPTDTSAAPGVGGGASGSTGNATAESENVSALAAAAKKGNFDKMTEGGRRFFSLKYKPTDLVAGNTLTVTLISVIGGTHCAAVASFRIVSVGGGDPTKLDKPQQFDVKAQYVYSSEFIDASSNVVAPRNFLVGKSADQTIKYSPEKPKAK